MTTMYGMWRRLLLAQSRTVVLILAMGLALAACGGDDDTSNLREATATPVEDNSSTSDETEEETEEPTEGPPEATDTPAPTDTPAATNTPRPTSTPTAPAGEIVIDKFGFGTYVDSGGSIILSWAAVITNTSAAQVAEDVEIEARFFDDANVLLASETATNTLVLSAQTTAIGSSYLAVEAVPTRMEVRLREADFITRANIVGIAIPPVVGEIDTTGFQTVVRATVTNPFNADIRQAAIVCTIEDAEGEIIAASTTFHEVLPAGGAARVECGVDSRTDISGAVGGFIYTGFTFITDLEIVE